MRASLELTLGIAVTVAALSTGCGSDTKPPDTVCQGHTCGAALLNDGGEIEMTNFLLPFGVPTTWAAATFYKNQSPGQMVLIPRNKCVDLRTGAYFPYESDQANAAPGNMKVDKRDYIDVGPKVVLTTVNNSTITLSKITDNFDYISRHQGIFYAVGAPNPPMLPFGPPVDQTLAGGPSYDTKGTYKVDIQGGADFPAQSWSGGVGSAKPGLVMPNRGHFHGIHVATSTSNSFPPCGSPGAPPPPVCCDPANGACPGPAFTVLPRDSLTFTWDTQDNIWDDELVFIAFITNDLNYVAQCNFDAKLGTATLTKADLDLLPEMGGYLAGHIIHEFNEVNGLRVHMVATSCADSFYAKMPAQ